MGNSSLCAVPPPGSGEAPAAFPASLALTPISRNPLRLPDSIVATVLDRAVPTTSLLQQGFHENPRPYPPTPLASIIVVTFNNLVFTRMCLESLLANTRAPAYEVIVVDNASSDGTPEYLTQLASYHPHLRVVRNEVNRGFAPANNQGLRLAAGEALVLLNNDTIVPPAWLSRLTRHLENPEVGLVGPVTNRICNEAQIPASYETYGELLQFAADYPLRHDGACFDIRMLAMFCMAMRRDVFERTGFIDERYQVGMLEDEDYSMSARAAGYRVVCAEDVFEHHFSQASFGNLIATGEFAQVYDANRERFESKWGVRWEPYQHRTSDEYLRLIDRIKELLRTATPPGATVIVVSKGDDNLLDLDGRPAWHFPRAEDGAYAGYYPTDGHEAIRHLEALRARGAHFLLLPATSEWWLQHYAGFAKHLQQHYKVTEKPDVGHLWDLRRHT